MQDACDWRAAVAATHGGRVLPLHVTPYIMALPYRIGAFEKLLANLAARPRAWFATGEEIVGSWQKQQ